MRKASLAVAVVFATFAVLPAFCTVPTIGDKNAEVRDLGASGVKPSIATDNAGYPHIVVLNSEASHTWRLYDKCVSGWIAPTTFSFDGYVGSANNPHIEVDWTTDRCWISGVMVVIGVLPECGLGILSRGNMSTAPSAISFVRRRMFDWSWPTGNLSTDPDSGNAIAWSNTGVWEELRWNGGIQKIAGGTALFPLNLGERPTGTFRVSKGPAVAHSGQGTRRVWHAAFGGHPNLGELRYSGYQNSVREAAKLGRVTWADSAVYPGHDEEDFTGLGTDRENGQAAYIAIDGRNGKIYLNIWNGSAMLASQSNPLTVSGTTGYNMRWGPQWADAKDGGAWLAYCRSSRVKVKYFSTDGNHGLEEDICDGTSPTIATDPDGNIHLAYMLSGRTYYRKVMTAGLAMISPIGQTTNHFPVFQWSDAVTPAPSQYRIWINKDAAQLTNTLVAGTTNQYVYPASLGIGNYQWWLKRTDGVDTNWVGPVDFSVVPPATTLYSPPNGMETRVSNDVRFVWAEVADANRYRLVVQTSGGATNWWVEGRTTTNYAPAGAGELPGGDCSWYVETASNAVIGLASAQRTFKLIAPPASTLTLPANHAGIVYTDTFQFAWAPAEGATWYQIWVNRNGGLMTNFWLQGSASTNWTPGSIGGRPTMADFSPAQYTWWVQSWSSYGYGPWSTPSDFTRTRIMNPNGGQVTDLRPQFSWSATAGATQYRIWINRDNTKLYDGWIAGQTNWTPTFDLGHGNYDWWIQDWNPASGAGPWLLPASFTIPDRTPGVAMLGPPGGVVAAGDTTYRWSTVQYSTWYYLWINNSAGIFHRQWFNGPTNATVNTPVGDYTWWVQTWNVDGYGPWSAGKGFTAGRCRPDNPIGNVLLTQTRPPFQWLPPPVATTGYRVWVNRGSTKVADQAIAGGGTTNWTPTAYWPSGTYTWWVLHNTAAAPGPWSSAATFRLQWGVPGQTTLVSPVAGGHAAGDVEYRWQADAAATRYRLWINKDAVKWYDQWQEIGALAGGTEIPVTISGHTSGTYTWWVVAEGPDGAGTWSVSGQFIVP